MRAKRLLTMFPMSPASPSGSRKPKHSPTLPPNKVCSVLKMNRKADQQCWSAFLFILSTEQKLLLYGLVLFLQKCLDIRHLTIRQAEFSGMHHFLNLPCAPPT